MSTFEALYDLSIRMLSASPNSDLGRLTLHHCKSVDEAAALVRAAVLTRVMPGEASDNRWSILRVFMRNLVNRSQAPMSAQAMLRCLDEVSLNAPDESARIDAVANAVAGNSKVSASLGAALARGRAPDGCNDYLDWLSARIEEYRHMPVAQINAKHVLSQLRSISSGQRTKIPNMGIALASNLLADLGIRVVCKPDLHVLPTMECILRVASLSPEDCIRGVLQLGQEDAPLVAASGRFDWLTGGLYPRDLDRIIYLIGSDNFRLNGTQNKREAPKRREVMKRALMEISGAGRQPQPTSTQRFEENRLNQNAMSATPQREAMPEWLRDWTPQSKFNATEFLSSRVVFYPGCGTDGQPVKYFGSRHAAHCFVFADYGVGKDEISTELEVTGHPFAGYSSLARMDIAKCDLTPSGWVSHIDARDAQHAPPAPISGVGRPYALLEILERQAGFGDTHGPQRLAILFLCADGVMAHDALFCQTGSTAPFAVVLQDHGWGGNWTRFGQGGSLQQLASSTRRLPAFLLVAQNTEAWDGYSVIEGTVAGGGGIHRFERQLWRLDPRLGDASTEPAAIPAGQSKADSQEVAVELAPRLPGQGRIVDAGDALRPSAQELFFDSIENTRAAQALVERVIATCEELTARLHHTYTDGGDLRVEPDRPTPHPRQQNVITMAWRPKKGYFYCQSLLSPHECVELGISADSVQRNAGPLGSKLIIRPGVDDDAFFSIVDLSIQRFREQ